VINFDLQNDQFDPFVHGFNFAAGMVEDIPKRIGTLEMVFKSKTNKGIIFTDTAKKVPLRKCNKTDDFPGYFKGKALVMMCFDPLQMQEEERSLNGDYYTPNFNYFQLQLMRC